MFKVESEVLSKVIILSRPLVFFGTVFDLSPTGLYEINVIRYTSYVLRTLTYLLCRVLRGVVIFNRKKIMGKYIPIEFLVKEYLSKVLLFDLTIVLNKEKFLEHVSFVIEDWVGFSNVQLLLSDR